MARRNIPLHVFHLRLLLDEGAFSGATSTWDRGHVPAIPRACCAGTMSRRAEDLRLDQPLRRPRPRPCSTRAMEKGYLLKQDQRRRVAVAICGRPVMGGGGLHQSRRLGLVSAAICGAFWTMGVDCFKTDFGERIPVRDMRVLRRLRPGAACTITTPICTTSAVLEVMLAGVQGRGPGGACLPAAPPRAARSSPCTGAATDSATYVSMSETLRRRPVPVPAPASASGATTSPASRAPLPPTCTSAGCRLAFCPPTAASTAPDSYRVPWLFGEEAVDVVLSKFTNLKCTPDALSVISRRWRPTEHRHAHDAAHGAWNSPRIPACDDAGPAVHAGRGDCWWPRCSGKTAGWITTCPRENGRICWTAGWSRAAAGCGKPTTFCPCLCGCGKIPRCPWAAGRIPRSMTSKRTWRFAAIR